MMTFDRVLPELIRLCAEDTATRAEIQRYCVARDVRGRARLIVEPKGKAAVSELERRLSGALGAYFVPPILSTKAGGNEQRLASQLFTRAKDAWPKGWPISYRNVLGGEDTPIEVGVRWVGLERTVGKEAWLANETPKPPWQLTERRAPPIVTFHSFKGGVGRTTMVGAYAIRLASESPARKVAVIDLDLEAPGIGSLFGIRSERGVLDVLVDHIATERIDLEGASMPAQLDSNLGQNITVFPAGSVNDSYIQKLARLDFSSTEPGKKNPVGYALEAMLHEIRSDHDIILLDARAGLHDLAGMSLHGLAHVDVLVFRSTTQNLEGLAQTLRTLGDRDDDPELVLIETLMPVKDDEFEARRLRTRAHVYELLLRYVYPEQDPEQELQGPPQLTDTGVAHDIVSVRHKDLLDSLDSFQGRVQGILNDSDLQAVARRIDELCFRDEDEDEDEDEE